MKILRCLYKNKKLWAVLRKNKVFFLEKSPFKEIIISDRQVSLNSVKILPPCKPTKIVLAGLNYKDHAKELKMPIPKKPVIFLKPPTSIIAHGENIIYPETVKQLDYEAELAVIIKNKIKNIPVSEVKKNILGYTCLNDITARKIQKEDKQWTRAKSFDTFCPIGPYIETKIKKNVSIKAYLNGKLKQNSSTNNFIFSIDYLISFISGIMTLMPSDIVSTGTPKGIGSMNPQDKIEIRIEQIGSLVNYVVSP